MEKIFSVLFLLLASFTFIFLVPEDQPQVLGAETTTQSHVLEASQPLQTQSRFETEIIEKKEVLERKTVVKNDDQMELDEEKVLEEGKDGQKTTVIKISYYEGKEYEREILSSETIPAEDKVIAKGTKIVWREAVVDGQTIRYWRKLRVYATHYDSRCLGCNETTAIGMRAGKGVIAVDPKVIKLRSKVFIPGYGEAVAGDTGGGN